MSQNPEIDDLFRATAYDSSGEKLGAVKQVYLDNRTGQPSFIEITHGLFGVGDSLVPLRGSRLEGDQLSLAFPKERIQDAPELDSGEGMTGDQEDELLHHYGVAFTPAASGYQDPRENRDAGEDRERSTSTRSGLGADSREDDRGDVGAQDRQDRQDTGAEEIQELGGEYRLRKYVITETRTIEVPVTHEEVVLERVNEDGTVTPVDGPEDLDPRR